MGNYEQINFRLQMCNKRLITSNSIHIVCPMNYLQGFKRLIMNNVLNSFYRRLPHVGGNLIVRLHHKKQTDETDFFHYDSNFNSFDFLSE